MKSSEIQRYSKLLEAKHRELSLGLRSRDEIAVENTADDLDAVQFAGERESAIRDLARESRLRSDVRNAIARIEDGSYGVCVQCEDAINPKRLAAVPWAAYCLHCQEDAERHASYNGASNFTLELSVT